MKDVSNLSPGTIRIAIDTLRYLARERENGFQIDDINMRHVFTALALVDVELSEAAPQKRSAHELRQAAE